MSSSKKIVLRSSDGELIEVDEDVAVQYSKQIKNVAEDTETDEIKLSEVSGRILNKIVEYMKKHADVEGEQDLKIWDSSFIKVDEDTLFDLMKAAHHLIIPKLLDLTLNTVAEMMGKSDTQDLRKLFKIKNDYTAEEEAKIRQENQEVFE